MYGLDLFSGIGGITKALEGYVQPVAYCENDRYAQGVLLSRMFAGDIPTAPLWDDVRTLRPLDLQYQPDIIYGGFPCQDISVAGKQVGLGGERSGLFFEIVRLARETNAEWLFLENVPNIRTKGLGRVLKELDAIGYDCRWGLLSASDVGANHKRERWFLLAHAGREPGTQKSPCTIAIGEGGNTRTNDGGRNGVSLPRNDWWVLEPSVGRVVNGVSRRLESSGKMESKINAHADCIKKASTASISDTPGVQYMWERSQSTTPPSRSARCAYCDVPLSEVPHENTPRCWYVGSWEQEVGGMSYLRQGLYAEAVKAEQDLRSSVPTRTWKTVCIPQVEKRTDRLRALGNAVVPAQTREAFERLMGFK